MLPVAPLPGVTANDVVVAGAMTTLVTRLVLASNGPVPAKAAVIGFAPNGSNEVVNVATPPVNVAVPRVVVPLRKVTVAPSVVAPSTAAGLSVAVNVTG